MGDNSQFSLKSSMCMHMWPDCQQSDSQSTVAARIICDHELCVIKCFWSKYLIWIRKSYVFHIYVRLYLPAHGGFTLGVHACIRIAEKEITNYLSLIFHEFFYHVINHYYRPIHWPLFVLGRKRPIHYIASVELPPSIAIIMYGKWGPTRLRGATVTNFWSITKNSGFNTTNS